MISDMNRKGRKGTQRKTNHMNLVNDLCAESYAQSRNGTSELRMNFFANLCVLCGEAVFVF